MSADVPRANPAPRGIDFAPETPLVNAVDSQLPTAPVPRLRRVARFAAGVLPRVAGETVCYGFIWLGRLSILGATNPPMFRVLAEAISGLLRVASSWLSTLRYRSDLNSYAGEGSEALEVSYRDRRHGTRVPHSRA